MSVAMGLASCDPTVKDLDRLVEDVLPCRTGVDNTFPGDSASGGGAVPPPPRDLAGDAAADVAALCRLGGTFGTSKAAFGCREDDVDWYDKLDELLDAFLRPSGSPCPAIKETIKGDDGCEGCETWEILLGDAFERLRPDGDCGRLPAFALDSVLWI
jgi:hypothetical protein